MQWHADHTLVFDEGDVMIGWSYLWAMQSGDFALSLFIIDFHFFHFPNQHTNIDGFRQFVTERTDIPNIN